MIVHVVELDGELPTLTVAGLPFSVASALAFVSEPAVVE